jgi:hypothetical protein
MKLGINHAQFGRYASPEAIAQVAQAGTEGAYPIANAPKTMLTRWRPPAIRASARGERRSTGLRGTRFLLVIDPAQQVAVLRSGARESSARLNCDRQDQLAHA